MLMLVFECCSYTMLLMIRCLELLTTLSSHVVIVTEDPAICSGHVVSLELVLHGLFMFIVTPCT